MEGRPHPGRAPAGGGDRGGSRPRSLRLLRAGLRPSNSRLLAPRSPGRRAGARGGGGVGGGGTVTAQGASGPPERACAGWWICRCLAWVCARVWPEFVLGSAGEWLCQSRACWGCGPGGWCGALPPVCVKEFSPCVLPRLRGGRSVVVWCTCVCSESCLCVLFGGESLAPGCLLALIVCVCCLSELFVCLRVRLARWAVFVSACVSCLCGLCLCLSPGHLAQLSVYGCLFSVQVSV